LDEKIKPTIDEKVQPIENSSKIIENLQLELDSLTFCKIDKLILSNSIKLNLKLEWDDYKLCITSDLIELFHNGVKCNNLPKDISQANKNTIGFKNFSILSLIKYLKSNQ
jgi:hypothetical protein